MSIRTMQHGSKVEDLLCHKACEHTHRTRSIERSKIFNGPLPELIVYSVAFMVAIVALQSLQSSRP